MEFKDLDLHPALKKAISKLNYINPTPIQEKAIPLIQEGKDLLASAQTGTGKTAAFLLPVLNRLAKPDKQPSNHPKVLILVPTRELALQVSEEAEKYSQFLPHIKVVTIFGGVPYPVQNRKLSRPYQILVATPGRLMDHMQRGKIKLTNIEAFILDEADRMLDMGFIRDIQKMISQLPRQRQSLFFSATMPQEILELSQKILGDPHKVTIKAKQATADRVEQALYYVSKKSKPNLLVHLLLENPVDSTLIFSRTKHGADKMSLKAAQI